MESQIGLSLATISAAKKLSQDIDVLILDSQAKEVC